MKRLLFISVSALLLCSSCVSKKKYLLAENGRLEAIGRGDALKEELIKCKDDNDALNNRIAALIRDTTTMGRDIRNYQTMLNTNMGEQDKLTDVVREMIRHHGIRIVRTGAAPVPQASAIMPPRRMISRAACCPAAP